MDSRLRALEWEYRERLARLDAKAPEDIDFSDMPEATDPAGWVRARDGRPLGTYAPRAVASR
ncbi:MAG: hypothetical protein IJR14_05920 [Synergistaceae bacterium]|nr:hypothetical protein [Synergistaceae bacterium]